VDFLNKYSFKLVLFVSLSVFFIVILSTIIYVNYRVSINEIVHLSATQQKTNLDLIKQNIEQKLRSLEANAVVLSRQSSLNKVINNHTGDYLGNSLTIDFSNSVYSNGDLHSIEVFMNNPPTSNIHNPVRYYSLEEAEQSNWIHLLANKNAAWIGIRSIEMFAGEEHVISHTRKILNSRGQTQAILSLNLDPLITENWLRSHPNDSTLYLINEQSHILASTDHTGIGENYISSGDFKNSPDQNEPYLINKDELVVTADLLNYNWELVATTPYEQITVSSKQVAKELLLFSLIITIFVLIVVYLLIKQLTKPIRQLTHLMNNYQLNRTIQVVPDDYKNEFGHLFVGYKNLITRSENLYNSLIEQYKRHKRADIRALQANINPHFLYNTLDQLNWRAIERGDDDMSEILELLGDMLRTGLSNGENLLTIEDEVEYVKKYLKLQVIRMQGTFCYQIDLNEQVSHAFIPKLTLQPFVENAIIHGLQEAEDGCITISIDEKDEQIHISIKDNGVGADSFSKNDNNIKTGGYGIENVKDRLNNYYSYNVKICLVNRPEGGVEVLLIIPKIVDKNKFSFL